MQVQSTLGVQSIKRMIMVIGGAGTGKTAYAATADRDPKKLFIIAGDEQGLETLRNNGLNIAYRAPGAKTPFDDTMVILRELHALKPFPYSCVIVDDVSTLQLSIKRWIAAAFKDEIISKSGKEDPRKLFGKLKDRMLDIMIQVKALPCHSVWTAWTKDAVEDENHKIVKQGGAMLEGATFDWLQGSANANIMLVQKKVSDGKITKSIREVRTKPYGGFALKDLRGNLPDPMPYDLVCSNDGKPPKWTHGMLDVLTCGISKKPNGVQRTA